MFYIDFIYVRCSHLILEVIDIVHLVYAVKLHVRTNLPILQILMIEEHFENLILYIS